MQLCLWAPCFCLRCTNTALSRWVTASLQTLASVHSLTNTAPLYSSTAPHKASPKANSRVLLRPPFQMRAFASEAMHVFVLLLFSSSLALSAFASVGNSLTGAWRSKSHSQQQDPCATVTHSILAGEPSSLSWKEVYFYIQHYENRCSHCLPGCLLNFGIL